MKIWRVFLLIFLMASAPWQVANAATGKVTGGAKFVIPDWFKVSFLDFPEELQELKGTDKHLLIFIHLDACPYCNRMLEENFHAGENKAFMQKHFDVIDMNFAGKKELTWIDGKTYQEHDLVQNKLGGYATPTIVFLNENGKKVAQLNGFRDTVAYRNVLEYVQGRAYTKQTLAQYLDSRKKPVVYKFNQHPLLSNVTNFKNFKKPLVLLFEDPYCGECARFHETTLNNPMVMDELKRFTFVRLDTESSQKIVTFDGKQMAAGEWAKSLGVTYRPGMVLFNGGKRRHTYDGRIFKHHFMERLHYVSGENYDKYKTYDDFKVVYRADLLKRGINVDFSE